MISLEFGGASSFILKAGAARTLPNVMESLGGRRALIVADPKVRQARSVESAIGAIGASERLSSVVFTDLEADATERAVRSAAELGRSARSDIVIGLGDDVALDTAKLASCLLGGSTKFEDIAGGGVAVKRLPLILLPVGTGAGSEATPISIVATPSRERKQYFCRKLLPDVALLDPELAIALPWNVTSAAAIQAMVNAIEAYTSRHKKNVLTDNLASTALGLLACNLPKALENPKDLAVRAEMLLGSILAGVAFANASGGAISALSSPVWAHYHVAHGVSRAPLLVPVLEFNAELAHVEYSELAEVVGARRGTAEGFIERIKEILVQSNLFVRMRDFGVSKGSLDRLARETMKRAGDLSNNPAEVNLASARRLYEQAF